MSLGFAELSPEVSSKNKREPITQIGSLFYFLKRNLRLRRIISKTGGEIR
jgi:hypothetical protein